MRSIRSMDLAGATPQALRWRIKRANQGPKRGVGRSFFALLFALVAGPALVAADAVIAKAMVGHWEGAARIIANWCKQQDLPVSLDLKPEGSVAGRVGDAELIAGRFERKRNWSGQHDERRTDYIVRGDLKGPILTAEGITRREVFIHLRWENGRFSGSLATSGRKVGGKERMSLSTISLHLEQRSDSPASE